MCVINEQLQQDKLTTKVDAEDDKMLVMYDPLETGSGYVIPRTLDFGARSIGDPLLYRSTNLVSSNTGPAKTCGKIGATRSRRQAGADARPVSRAAIS
ncbi:hypothetical protein N2603_37675 [Bradyrhizobium huanghuaihaiense]|uniref:hypothetical protein n=1 Tax=Bradyrhizobium huanghuaihaiense TaxID=990078 RepID=UPI0021A9AA3A|nr:hypothetical protein [Bradyrhizobium sp. CB3035]UWU75675.1 hypothetical protein N2603_37675 [Bradyrhizobium sp. CB3035]